MISLKRVHSSTSTEQGIEANNNCRQGRSVFPSLPLAMQHAPNIRYEVRSQAPLSHGREPTVAATGVNKVSLAGHLPSSTAPQHHHHHRNPSPNRPSPFPPEPSKQATKPPRPIPSQHRQTQTRLRLCTTAHACVLETLPASKPNSPRGHTIAPSPSRPLLPLTSATPPRTRVQHKPSDPHPHHECIA